MITDIYVVPNSKKFSISKKDGRIKIHLKSPPENNKANIELIKELSSILGCEIRILSGQSSKHKKLLILANESSWENLINAQD